MKAAYFNQEHDSVPFKFKIAVFDHPGRRVAPGSAIAQSQQILQRVAYKLHPRIFTMCNILEQKLFPCAKNKHFQQNPVKHFDSVKHPGPAFTPW